MFKYIYLARVSFGGILSVDDAINILPGKPEIDYFKETLSDSDQAIADIIFDPFRHNTPIPSDANYTINANLRDHKLFYPLWWERYTAHILCDLMSRFLIFCQHHKLCVYDIDKIIQIHPEVRKYLGMNHDEQPHPHIFIEYSHQKKNILFISFYKLNHLCQIHDLDEEEEITDICTKTGNVVIIERLFFFLKYMTTRAQNLSIDPAFKGWKFQLKRLYLLLTEDFDLSKESWSDWIEEFGQHAVRAILGKETRLQMISKTDQVCFLFFGFFFFLCIIFIYFICCIYNNIRRIVAEG